MEQLNESFETVKRSIGPADTAYVYIQTPYGFGQELNVGTANVTVAGQCAEFSRKWAEQKEKEKQEEAKAASLSTAAAASSTAAVSVAGSAAVAAAAKKPEAKSKKDDSHLYMVMDEEPATASDTIGLAALTIGSAPLKTTEVVVVVPAISAAGAAAAVAAPVADSVANTTTTTAAVAKAASAVPSKEVPVAKTVEATGAAKAKPEATSTPKLLEDYDFLDEYTGHLPPKPLAQPQTQTQPKAVEMTAAGAAAGKQPAAASDLNTTTKSASPKAAGVAPAAIDNKDKKAEDAALTWNHNTGRLRFHPDVIRDLFKQPLDCIIAMLDKLLITHDVESVDIIGGFSASPMVRHRLTAFLATCNRVPTIPPHPEIAVLTGAVMFGLKPQSLRTRVMQRTYGMRVSDDYNPNKHSARRNAAELTVVKGKEIYQMNNLWSNLCQVGDSIHSDEYRRVQLYPTHDKQKQLVVDIYQSSKRGNMYVDEDATSIRKLGQLVVDIPHDGVPLLSKLFVVNIWFGSEIVVKVFGGREKSEIRILYEDE
jgi:hypothetical protein